MTNPNYNLIQFHRLFVIRSHGPDGSHVRVNERDYVGGVRTSETSPNGPDGI